MCERAYHVLELRGETVKVGRLEVGQQAVDLGERGAHGRRRALVLDALLARQLVENLAAGQELGRSKNKVVGERTSGGHEHGRLSFGSAQRRTLSLEVVTKGGIES